MVTGCNPWTVYQYDNYQGASACLFPSDVNNCYPGFYPSSGDLGGLAGQISSVVRGCFSANKLSPVEVPKMESKNGKVGGASVLN